MALLAKLLTIDGLNELNHEIIKSQIAKTPCIVMSADELHKINIYLAEIVANTLGVAYDGGIFSHELCNQRFLVWIHWAHCHIYHSGFKQCEQCWDNGDIPCGCKILRNKVLCQLVSEAKLCIR